MSASNPAHHAYTVRAPGRAFVCGDVHGLYAELNQALVAVSFDHAQDHLFALGDLVDRGPNSADCLRLLNKRWFHSVLGNHEDMMISAHHGIYTRLHVENGGQWFQDTPQEARAALYTLALSMPYAITVTSPTGRTYGLVHADYPGTSWPEFIQSLDRRAVRQYALWQRNRYYGVKSSSPHLKPPVGVDHVYIGHTSPGPQPATHNGYTFMDASTYGAVNLVELV